MEPLPTHPDADAWRALARSSPWRFTRLEWTHETWDGASGTPRSARAWLERPGRLTVQDPDGSVRRSEGVPYATSLWDRRRPTPPATVEPRRRPDGLVLERPSPLLVDYDDPLDGGFSFTWVAMLDPVELADGTEVDEVVAVEVGGRPGWAADVRPTDGYQARCAGCCDLLASRTAQEIAFPDGGGWLEEADLGSLPTAYRAVLDVQTGVLVRLSPLDGEGGTRLRNTIHAVDGAAPAWLGAGP